MVVHLQHMKIIAAALSGSKHSEAMSLVRDGVFFTAFPQYLKLKYPKFSSGLFNTSLIPNKVYIQNVFCFMKCIKDK